VQPGAIQLHDPELTHVALVWNWLHVSAHLEQLAPSVKKAAFAHAVPGQEEEDDVLHAPAENER